MESRSAIGWMLGGGIEESSTAFEDGFVPRLFGVDEGLGELVEDTGLEELVCVSLFTWARAHPSDELLESTGKNRDRRGWWGESFGADENDRFGSRLWLLLRSRVTAETLERARNYASEALQWMIADGIAERIDVEVEQVDAGFGLSVQITRGSGETVELRFPRIWESLINAGD